MLLAGPVAALRLHGRRVGARNFHQQSHRAFAAGTRRRRWQGPIQVACLRPGGEGLRSGAGASGLSDSVQGDRERLVEVLGGDGGGTKRAQGRGGSLSMPPPAATQAAMGITRWPPSTTAVSCTPLRRTTTLLMHGPAPVAPRAPPKARALNQGLEPKFMLEPKWLRNLIKSNPLLQSV